MNRWLKLCFLMISMVFTGCLNTFFPIFTTENLVIEHKLLGTWQFENEKLLIEKAEDPKNLPARLQPFAAKLMYLSSIERKEETKDLAALVKIGDYYFLDLFPEYTDMEKKLDPFYLNLFGRQHTIYRVDSFQTGDRIFLQRVSDKLMSEQIEQKKIRVKTITRQDGSLILAPTEELQAHIRKYAGDPVFYENDNSHTYSRIK